MKTRTIDPTHLDQDTSNLLSRFLDAAKGAEVNVIEENVAYQFGHDNKLVSIKIPYRLVHRSVFNTWTGREESKYSVVNIIDDHLVSGECKGATGVTYQLLGTLSSKRKLGLVNKKNKNRIDKIIFQPDFRQTLRDPENKLTETELFNKFIAKAHKEAKILQWIGYPHAKPIVIEQNTANNEILFHIIMKKFKGVSLAQLMANDSDGSAPLTVAERIQLSKNLLRALKEQVHDKGVIHRDIKPENIIVNKDTLEVTIVDFGHATTEPTVFFGGSPGFIAPETCVESKADQRSDNFSMGLVLAYVWNNGRKDDKFPDLSTAEFVNLIVNNAKNKVSEKFDDLFTGIKGILTASEEKEIKSAIVGLTKFASNERIDEEAAYKIFDKVQISYGKLAPPVRKAHQVAELLNESLYKIQIDSTLQEPLDSIVGFVYVALARINSDEELAEFVKTLNVKAFKGMTSKRQIKAKLAKIIKDFKSKRDGLLELMREVDVGYFRLRDVPGRTPELHEFMDELGDDINNLLNKSKNLTLSIDELCKLNKRYNQKLPSIDRRFKQFKESDWVKQIAEDGRHLYKDISTQMGISNRLLKLFRDSHTEQGKIFATEVQQLIAKTTALLSQYRNNEQVTNVAAYERLRNLKRAFTQFNQRLEHGIAQTEFNNIVRLKRVMSLYKIAAHFGDNHQKLHNDLEKLKNRIRSAIASYINSTLTTKNIKNRDRAASVERYEDIIDILKIVGNATNEAQLIKEVGHRITTDKKFTHAFFGSTLRNNINAAINTPINNKLIKVR